MDLGKTRNIAMLTLTVIVIAYGSGENPEIFRFSTVVHGSVHGAPSGDLYARAIGLEPAHAQAPRFGFTPSWAGERIAKTDSAFRLHAILGW